MKIKVFLRICILITVSAIFCSGCAVKQKTAVIKKFDADTPASSISSQALAENNSYKLFWEDEKKCVLLTDKASGKVWSNIPYEYYLSGGASANVNSTLNITVADAVSLQLTTVRGYSEAVEGGRIFSEKIADGIRITYCFDKYSVSVPVEYTLRNDSLLVTIDTPGICENSDFLLVSVTLAPFLCSAQNTSDDSYLFVPSGSGALMYAKNTAEQERTYKAEMFGTDASRPVPEVLSNEEAIRLPVFGVKNKQNAMLGIIEKNAGAAVIEASAGNSRTGYSNICPVFYFRGYDVFDKSVYKSLKDDLTRVSSAMSQTPVSVGFYPLSGEDADYNGMAKRYRRYLADNNLLVKSNTEKSSYSLTFLGGVLTTSSVAGIPTKTLKKMTTLKEAKNILSELYSTIGTAPAVRLSGFGATGINPGKIAGNYVFSKKLGSETDRKALEEYCQKQGNLLFCDFDLIRYSKSGAGFSYLSSPAKTAILKAAEQYPVKIPLRQFDETMPYRLIGRANLNDALSFLLEKAKQNSVSGIGLTTLGEVAYSDYSDFTYVAKGKIENQVSEMIKTARKSGFNTASGSNSYAAAAADTVFDAPVENGGYDAFDEQIPFYSMVFHDSKPIFCEAVNLAADARKQAALAVSGGMGLGFTLINDYDVSFAETGEEKLYGAVYTDNKVLISEYVREYEPLYKAVSGKAITSYEKLTENVSKTVFENGITVYTNHSGSQVKCPIGELDAYKYLWK